MEQEAEESFDLALIASLEVDVVPHIGDPRVPDSLVSQLGKILQQGSKLYDMDDGRPSSPTYSINGMSSSRDSSFEKVDLRNESANAFGTTEGLALLPRERFSYWCFDLLFLICNDAMQEQGGERRLAALNLPPLLSRCRTTLVSYVEDEKLRGNLPFVRYLF